MDVWEKPTIFACQLPENIVQPSWFPMQRSGGRFWRQELKQTEDFTKDSQKKLVTFCSRDDFSPEIRSEVLKVAAEVVWHIALHIENAIL